MLGKKIKEFREEKNLLLRQVAAYLEVDTALMSKVERGERNLQRDQVIKLAKLFNTPEEDLIAMWLSDKIFNLVEGDIYALKGIKRTLNRFKQ